jgi:hypothetical protein
MRYPSLLILFIFFLSCNSKNQDSEVIETASVQKSISLEKLDSIQIDYLGNPTVHDIDPKSGTVLFMDHKEFSEDIFIADFEGNILSSFSKFGDVLDTYGALMSTIKITGSGSFLVYGYKGFFTYDFDGKLLSLVKYDDFQVPNERMTAMGFGMENLTDKLLYLNFEPRPSEVRQYKDLKLLSIIDPVGGKRNPIIGFPENSVFLNGNYFFSPCWFPVFTHDEDHIYVAFGLEPVIHVYEAKEPYSLKSSILLDLPDYNYSKGTEDPNDFRFISMIFSSGRIDNIKKIDGKYIVAYFPGYNATDTETNFENKSPEEANIFREKMLKKYPKRIAILDSLGNVINDFVPDGLEPRSMLLRNGELWMMEKPDEEEEKDYFRLFRVGLKKEGY